MISALLPFDADLIQQNAAAIAQQLLIIHAGGPRFQESADYWAVQNRRLSFYGSDKKLRAKAGHKKRASEDARQVFIKPAWLR